MKRFEDQLFQKMEETILSDGFLEDYIQRCQTDSPQEKAGWQKQHESVVKELRQIEQRMENLITTLADAPLPKLEVFHRYKKEEAKKKELKARLCRQKMVATDFKVDLEEFRHPMRLELRREETRKASLDALIEEIVDYSDAMIEVKYRSETGIELPQRRLKRTMTPCMYHHGGTYITSDNFPAQKIQPQNSIMI